MKRTAQADGNKLLPRPTSSSMTNTGLTHPTERVPIENDDIALRVQTLETPNLNEHNLDEEDTHSELAGTSNW